MDDFDGTWELNVSVATETDRLEDLSVENETVDVSASEADVENENDEKEEGEGENLCNYVKEPSQVAPFLSTTLVSKRVEIN